MTAQAEGFPKVDKGRWGEKNLLIRGGTAGTLYRGTLAAHRIGSQLVENPDPNAARTDLIYVGVFENEPVITTATGTSSQAIDANGADIIGRIGNGIRGPFDTGTSGNAITMANLDEMVFGYDNNTVYLTDLTGTLSPVGTVAMVDENGGVWINFDDAPLASLIDTGANNLVTFENTLASTSHNDGAHLIGIEDAGTFTAATTVEAGLAELYQHLFSAVGGYISIPLSAWREVNATGDVSNIAANGGVLASDTTPVFDAVATSNEHEIFWATGNVDPIGVSVILPRDFDDTADATLDLVVSSGTTNAATIVCASAWSAGAAGSEVSDSTSDTATKSATPHTLSVVIDNGDIPAGARRATFRLTPPTHATDTISVYATGIAYKRKLLTS